MIRKQHNQRGKHLRHSTHPQFVCARLLCEWLLLYMSIGSLLNQYILSFKLNMSGDMEGLKLKTEMLKNHRGLDE